MIFLGEEGAQGLPGFTGADGMPGIMGEFGYRGDIGYPGPPGPSGVKGLPGPKGFKGFRGDTGRDGYEGLMVFTQKTFIHLFGVFLLPCFVNPTVSYRVSLENQAKLEILDYLAMTDKKENQHSVDKKEKVVIVV